MNIYQCPSCGIQSTVGQGHNCINNKFIWGTDLKLYYQFKEWDQCPIGISTGPSNYSPYTHEGVRQRNGGIINLMEQMNQG